ncbi:MAG: transketolase family protein [Acetivibrionales bacterium]|jgi:transketolase
MEMRQVLNTELKRLMSLDQNIVLVEADLARANGTWDIREVYPDRVFEVGVAEQNMVTIAAGLASYGFIPICGSFTPFITRRACDQVAISVCYTGLNVKLLGTDEGIAAELNGGTHMSVEDISVMRGIPDLVIFSPADNIELEKALKPIIEYNGPVYIRIQRKVVPDIHDSSNEFDLFKADVIKEGKDITITSMGGIMPQEVLKAIELLDSQGIDVEYINVHTIKPLDEETILRSIKKTGCLVTCDNHNIIGGLGSALAELSARQYPVPIEMIGIHDHFGEVGKMPYLKEKYHMTAKDIAAAATRALARK